MEVSTSELLLLLGKLYVEKELVVGEREALALQLAELRASRETEPVTLPVSEVSS